MQPTDYDALDDLHLLALCMWREGSNQPSDGRRAIGHVIRNRAAKPCWWGNSISSVILNPWQFSSFPVFKSGINVNKDPNCHRWPENEEEPAWIDSLGLASVILEGTDHDNTSGATHYYDLSIGWPKAWGNQADYMNTLNIARLRFWKLAPVTNHDAVADAVAEG
jgi:hypothetical protein